MSFIAKNISLQAWPGDPNDWNLYGNRDYVISQARCGWVRLWLTWTAVEGNAQYSTDATGVSYPYYNTLDYFKVLDGWIADANANGVAVLLSMSQYFPNWSNGTTPGQQEPGTGKDGQLRFPTDLSTSSPWAAFLAYAYNRYRAHSDDGGYSWHGLYNDSGPNPANWYGNPRAAWISGLSIVNEPNLEAWQDDNPGCVAAQMIQTMDAAVAFWNAYAPAPSGACALFAPDIADHTTVYNGSTLRVSDYLDTTKVVLQVLANWRPYNYWVWSHHTYQDIANGTNDRANQVRQALYDNNWRGGGDRNVYFTEGGWHMGSYADATTQRDKFVNWWNLSRNADFRMGTQHQIRDTSPGWAMVDHASNYQFPLWYDFANLQPRR